MNREMNKQIKKITIGALIAGQILTAQVFAAPQNVVKEFNKQQEVRMELGNFKQDIKIFLVKNGQRVRIDKNMKDGLRVISGRTCVGVRDLTNAIEGARVDWDSTNKVVDVYNNGKSLAYPINKKLMWDGVQIKGTDVPATIDAAISKTFLPLRSIAENLGYRVDWEDATHEVTLVKPGENYVKEPAPAPQPKPAPSQGQASAYMTASGQVIPKASELGITDMYSFNETPQNTKYIYAKPEDIIDNGDNTVTYFKGTAIEYTLVKPFPAVAHSPANPNFKIAGPNTGDNRIGTAEITVGTPLFDNALAESQAIYKEKFIKAGLNHLKDFRDVVGKRQDRLIPKQKVLSEFKKLTLSPETKIDFSEEDMETFYIFYDYTGILNTNLVSVNHTTFITSMHFSPSYFITDKNYMYHVGEEPPKGHVVDKVVCRYGTSAYYIVDIPDINPRQPHMEGTGLFFFGNTKYAQVRRVK